MKQQERSSTAEKRLCESAALQVEKRAEGEAAGRPVIVGYAAVYNELSLPIERTFRERIAPGTFTSALARNPDVRALIEHDPSRVLGRTKSGTLRLTNNAKGLRVEIDPPDTTAGRDIVESIRRGDVDQMSFAFRTVGDSWADEIIDGERWPVRTLNDLELEDVSIAARGVYPQTEAGVGLRSAHAFAASRKSDAIAILVRYLQLFPQN